MEMKNKRIKCYCSVCHHDTNHEVIAAIDEQSENPEFWWMSTYKIVKCCGCETLAFQIEEVSEDNITYDVFGECQFIPTFTMFPHSKGDVRMLDLASIPNKIKDIYKETIIAYNTKCYLLSAAGARAIIEAICSDKHVLGRNLDSKINNLHKNGHITKNDRDRLHAVRFIGNDFLHEIIMPESKQLKLVIDIIHALLNNLYIIDISCQSLVKPISNFQEFEILLNEGLSHRKVGEVDILKHFLPKDKRIIYEDLTKFEKELQDKIRNAEYTKLSLCKTTKIPPHQQYKIEYI